LIDLTTHLQDPAGDSTSSVGSFNFNQRITLMYNVENLETETKENTYRTLSDELGLTLVKLDGKKPIESGWPSLEPRCYDQIAFEEGHNAGIVCGEKNGILVLDVDDREKFDKALADNGWDLPETYTVRTGSGGHHYYFKYPSDGNDYRNRTIKAMGFDIRANGGMVVAPGSIHPETGEEYTVEMDANYHEAPQWLQKLSLDTKGDTALDDVECSDPVDLDTLDVVPSVIEKIRNGVLQGQRSEAMWHVMLSLMSVGLSDGQILGIFQEYPIGAKGNEQGPEWMTEQILRARGHHTEATPKLNLEDLLEGLEKSDQGDAEIFKKLFKDKFCYDCALGKWFVFNGITWEPDVTEQAFSSVEMVADEYKKQVIMLKTRVQKGDVEPDLQKCIKEFTDKSKGLNTVGKRKSVLRLARSGDPDRSLGLYGTEWNTDPWIFGCANGVIDLKTGELRKGRPEDLIRIASPVTWEGLEAPAPIWEEFIEDLFDGHRDLIEYLHRLFGLTMIGKTLEAVLPVLIGKGRNGKSTMFNVLGHIMGEYGSSIPAETLLKQSQSSSASSHTSHLFLFKDRRLVWTSEIEEGRYFNAAEAKRLSGGDPIVGRRAYGSDNESFVPTHTMMMLTNSKPRIKDPNDYALFKRLHLIPFKLSFVLDPKEDHERQADPELENKLKSSEEASGILAWLVRGTLKYLEEGSLRPPQVVLDATKEYQQDEDTFGHFLEDCCESVVGARTISSDIYKAYHDWTATNGHSAMSSQKFHQKMRDRYDERKSGVRVYLDVEIIGFTPKDF
jgi:putative DNA primase/helicase